MRYKGIMLLRRNTGKRLKPVGIVGCAMLNCPVLHFLCHHVRCRHGQFPALIHDPLYLFKYIFRQAAPHFRQVKYILAKQLFYIHQLTHFFTFPPQKTEKCSKRLRFGTSSFLYSCIQFLSTPLRYSTFFDFARGKINFVT